MDRNELLRDQIRENKDQQTILVTAWHPKLSIPNYRIYLISSVFKLSKLFKQKPTATCQRNKSLQISF